MEELGIEVEVQEPFITVEHNYSDFRITLHTFHCRILHGKPRAIACANWSWAGITDLFSYDFSAADKKIVTKLQSHFVQK